MKNPPTYKQEEPRGIQQMYGDYYLEYASYVILERAVPHVLDGLKPVQRRILHAMERIDDGRFNKVANIVGDTMKYHPHGDASIGSALVVLGQKGLLVDTQGNWGNILTGDCAAAARYIEARLSSFAKEILFSPKVTDWKFSYDGRNKEPITLPAKFPLLLAQGALGIAVGMNCLIMPHNFNEILDAAIKHLRGESFELYPDFLTGGIVDVSGYNDGRSGSRIRCRARIDISQKRCLRIREIPFGTTTESIIVSIESAVEKGKIKIARIEDNTAAEADILIHLPGGADIAKLCHALYAFTECQISISPKAVVIIDKKPAFIGVSDILKHNVTATQKTLKLELEVKLAEWREAWMQASLEKIFIENRIYKVLEESESWKDSLLEIDEQLQPFCEAFLRPITSEDIVRLTEIKIRKIAKYEVHSAVKYISKLEGEIEKNIKNLANITRFTIRWYEGLRKRYGAAWPRRSEMGEFEQISRVQAAVENETLYIDDEGFAGYALKKGTPIGICSTVSNLITIDNQGVLCVRRMQEKLYVGKKLRYIGIHRAHEERIFNLIYRDGKEGVSYAKSFRVGGFTRDKEYALTQGTLGSRILFFSDHADEEDAKAITVNVFLKNQILSLRRPIIFAFSRLRVKARSSQGNIVTKNPVDRIARAAIIREDSPIVLSVKSEDSTNSEAALNSSTKPRTVPSKDESLHQSSFEELLSPTLPTELSGNQEEK